MSVCTPVFSGRGVADWTFVHGVATVGIDGRHGMLCRWYGWCRGRTVVIGSGISGASFVRTLLNADRQRVNKGEHEHKRPSVLMLEAHDACSGATGRLVSFIALGIERCKHALPTQERWSHQPTFIP